MKRMIRKIVALGTGCAMLGATLLGATATADLAQYPEPFIKDGNFNALMVIGNTAAPEDIIGGIDVASSLQYYMKQTEQVTITDTTTVELEGKKIESAGTKLRYGDLLSDVTKNILPEDLPNVLVKEGELDGEDNEEYEYKTSIKVPDAQITFGEPGNEDKPIIYLDLNSGVSWTNVIEFPKAVDPEELVDEPINLFGREFTFSGKEGELENDEITLYGAAIDQTFTAGDVTTVKLENEDGTEEEIDVEVVGVNTQSDDDKATLKVNGETRSVEAGKSYHIGGINVYVKEVYAYTAPVTSGGVRLFIGSDKFVLEDGSGVRTGRGTHEIEGTNVEIVNDGTRISKINIMVEPTNFDDEIEYIGINEDGITDPVFGTFKLAFTGLTPALDSEDDRDMIEVNPSSNKCKVKWTNKDDTEYNLDMFYEEGDVLYFGNDDDRNIVTTNSSVFDDDYFIISNRGYTHMLQLTKVDDDPTEINVKDGSVSHTFSYDDNTMKGDLLFNGYDYEFEVIDTGGNAEIIVKDATDTIVTKSGAQLTFLYDQNTTVGQILFNEASDFNDASSDVENTYADVYNITVVYDGDEVVTRMLGVDWFSDDSDDEYAMTPYGSYLKYDDDNFQIDINYPVDAVIYDVYFAPTDAVSKIIEDKNTVETTTIKKISVGMAKLASEIANIEAQNMIVIGGPCVNRVSAALMNNPGNCAEGFVEGSAKVKLFEHANGNVAMMIAGYSAQDTMRAVRVVSEYDKWSGFAGDELEVTGTTLTDISIASPTVTTTTTTTTTEEATTTTEA